MANFTLPSFPRSPRPTPPRDALAAAVAELKARLDAASVSFPRLSSAAALHLVDSYADALALAASLADDDVVLVGGSDWYYVDSHELVRFYPAGDDSRIAAVEAKIPAEATPSNQLADKAYVVAALARIVGGAPEAYDTLREIADWILDDGSGAAKIVADVLALRNGKRDKADFSVGDGWLLVKPDGAQVWLVKPDPQQDTWVGDGFTLAYETTEAYWGLAKVDASGDWVVDGSDDSPPDANRLEFTGSDDTSAYRLVRGSRLALDTEIPLADSAVTRTSANPVKSSGIWSAIWGALTASPAGFASLYDWCVAQLSGKRGKTDLAVYTMSDWHNGSAGTEVAFRYDEASGEWIGEPGIIYAEGHRLRYNVAEGEWQYVLSSGYVTGLSADENAMELRPAGYLISRPSVYVKTSDKLAKTSQLEQKQDALSAAQLADLDVARWPSSVRAPSAGGAVALLDRTVNVVDVTAVVGDPVARWTWSDGMDWGPPEERDGTWYPPATLMSYELSGSSEDGDQLVLEFRDGSAGTASWFGGYDYAVLSTDSVTSAYGSPVRDASLSAAVGRDAGWLLVTDWGMDPVYMLFGVPIVTYNTGMTWEVDASGWDGVPLAVRRVQSYDGMSGTVGDEVTEFTATWTGMSSPSETSNYGDMSWEFSEGSVAGLFAVRDYYRPVESQSVSSLSLPAAPASGLRAFDVLWTAPEGISSASRPSGASYLAPDGAFPPLGGGARLVSFREVSTGRFAVWHRELQEVT